VRVEVALQGLHGPDAEDAVPGGADPRLQFPDRAGFGCPVGGGDVDPHLDGLPCRWAEVAVDGQLGLRPSPGVEERLEAADGEGAEGAVDDEGGGLGLRGLGAVADVLPDEGEEVRPGEAGAGVGVAGAEGGERAGDVDVPADALAGAVLDLRDVESADGDAVLLAPGSGALGGVVEELPAVGVGPLVEGLLRVAGEFELDAVAVQSGRGPCFVFVADAWDDAVVVDAVMRRRFLRGGGEVAGDVLGGGGPLGDFPCRGSRRRGRLRGGRGR
jgi:hypothetical protein